MKLIGACFLDYVNTLSRGNTLGMCQTLVEKGVEGGWIKNQLHAKNTS